MTSVKSEGNKLLERRRSSQISHINRIRDANAKRQFVSIWEDSEEYNDKLKQAGNVKKSSSAYAIKEKTSHEACVPYHSVERFDSVSTEDRKYVHRTLGKRKMSKKVKPRQSLENKRISSQEKNLSQKPKTASQRLGLKKRISKKTLAQEDASRELLEKPVKIPKRRSSRNGNVKTNLKKKSLKNKTRRASNLVKRDQTAKKKLDENEYSKISSSDSDKTLENSDDDIEDDVANLKNGKKFPKAVKKDQIHQKYLNENEYLEKHLQDSDNDSENSAYDTLANAANLKKPVTAKDVIVLKWLHKMKCPETRKSDASDEDMNFKGDKKISIEILGPPARKDDKERYGDIPEEEGRSKSLEFHPSIEHVFLDEISPKSIFSENVNLKTRKSIEYQQKESEESSPNVEMRVTELGKLQIILNLKSLSPEDSAVVIWLDDLRKSDMKPDFKKRLSISSFENMQQVSRTSVLKSHSSQALEDDTSPKPKIYFPPVTILKNLAVGSKDKLRDLKTDSSESVYYKRCNLTHSEEFMQFNIGSNNETL